ncbi:MAG: hypothetical protein IT355_13175 [Gemmatimonadaceae bacterium]|nr:hypothetical protein [Gemmatimonadaceae bacterium]
MPEGDTLALLLMQTGAPQDSSDGEARAHDTQDALRAVDSTPRVTVLTRQQAMVTMAEGDAELLVVALGAALRAGAGATTALTVEEVARVRQVAVLVHRTLPPRVRAAIRVRADRMAVPTATASTTNSHTDDLW